MGKNLNEMGVGEWVIKVIGCGYHITPKVQLAAGFDEDMIISLPYQCFLLQGYGMNILVDCGMNERMHPYGDVMGKIVFYSTSVQFLESLEKEGLKPEDIDMMIYTHLHADHAGNANFFPNTRVIVQKDEYNALLNPCIKEKELELYDQGVIPVFENNPNLQLIEGDIDLMEGIRLIKTPGHTRGHMSLVINSVNGLRILVGDLFHLPIGPFPQLDKLMDYEGVWHDVTPAPESWTVMPSSLVLNFFDFYDSVDKVRAHMPKNDPKYLICGHDAELRFKDQL